MKSIYIIIFFCLCSITSCSQIQNKKLNVGTPKYKFTNQLIHESSPYLLQHAHNPVNWYPWGKDALDKAKTENKLIIISVGYAACHWCHVMEHESFENEKVAEYMNEHFVSIKVDREERPDIDQIYMTAVQLITGRGGWPLNCIALPNGQPIFGGTYFTSKQWIDMLSKVQRIEKDNPEKIRQQAKLITEGVKSSELVHLSKEKLEFSIDDINHIFNHWKKDLDDVQGGQNGAPKFPLPIGYQFLLHYHYITQNAEALKTIILTLDKMADGGIYDQIGGGFARYSTDSYWKVPHFEKMLYDNAQLVSLYASAYKVTQNEYYKTIVEETLDFIQREMTSDESGFYSSLDADSEGEEGKFYIWTQEDLEFALGKKARIIIDYYNVKKEGNWENSKNILFKSGDDKRIIEKYKITKNTLSKQVLNAKKILLNLRSKRIRPSLDNKIITSWNALMIKAYVDAYKTFGYKKYLNTALRSANFIKAKVKTIEGGLYRNYKEGKASINGFLDDYAFTIEAFIALYQASFDEKWLIEAKQLTDYTITHFYDKTSGMFFYTSDIDPVLIARKMEISDNVMPSSNSEMAKNLFILGHYFYNNSYIDWSKKMLNNVKQKALNSGPYYANWDILMNWFVSPPYELAIVGSQFEAKQREFNKIYLPNVFLSGGEDEGHLPLLKGKLAKGQTTIYVCQDKACKLPVTEIKNALKQIKK